MVKTKASRGVRIKGVVKAMNQARLRVARGFSAAEAGRFRAWVRGVTGQVEQICREHRIEPASLPAPTYRAYQALKAIDLENLPGPQVGAAPTRSVRISNLVKTVEIVQEQLDALAGVTSQVEAEQKSREVRDRLSESLESITAVLRQSQAGASELAGPSRRALEWLRFLGEPEHFDRHVQALRVAQEAAARTACRAKLPTALRAIPIRVRFYHQPALYRARLYERAYELKANEGFIAAPPPALEALVCAALHGGSSAYLDQVKSFGLEPGYRAVQAGLSGQVGLQAASPRGQVYDLALVFERINRAYFNSAIPQPQLTWNRQLTWRKLGHYEPATDTILLSISLDRPEIPPEVVDFVMYHELLHKVLGVELVDGRQRAHTPEFRRRERQFKNYQAVQDLLKNPAGPLAKMDRTRF